MFVCLQRDKKLEMERDADDYEPIIANDLQRSYQLGMLSSREEQRTIQESTSCSGYAAAPLCSP